MRGLENKEKRETWIDDRRSHSELLTLLACLSTAAAFIEDNDTKFLFECQGVHSLMCAYCP